MRSRISQPRFVLVMAVACLALLAGARTAGAAGWLPAGPPATAANGPSGAVVAVDPAGDAIAAWTGDDGAGAQSLIVATRPAGGPWSTPAPLASDVGVDAPAVTMDAAGKATVVWIESADGSAFAVHARRRDAASGTWGATHDFPASSNVADPLTQVRADALGNVIAAWVEHDPNTGVASVRAAVADGGGGAWSLPATLSDPADASVAFDRPQIAPAADGGALVGWTAQRIAGLLDFAIQTSTYTGGGVWGTARDLLSSSDAISPLRLVGSGGNVVATWFQGSPWAPWSAFRLNDRWSVDSLGDEFAVGCVPMQALGADEGGGATVVWKTQSTGGLDAVRLTAGGPETETPVFSPSTEIVEDVAIDHGTVVLVAHDSSTETEEALASRRSGNGWSTPALLDSAPAGVGLAGPDVATDAAGDTLATWTATDGLGAKSVAAAAFQVTAPRLSDVRVPAIGTAGAQLSFSADARSTFASIAQTSWDFGDGTPAAGGASVSHAFAQAGTYTVTVTATDLVGNVTQATRQIAVAPAPGTTPPASPKPAALVRPRIGGAPKGVLVLARRARTLKLLIRNPNAVRLTGSATLVRPRSGRRAALTLASRKSVRFPAGKRTTLTLTLTDPALRALKRASGFRLPVRLTLHLRAADGRRTSATLRATLDASARFAVGRARIPSARMAC